MQRKYEIQQRKYERCQKIAELEGLPSDARLSKQQAILSLEEAHKYYELAKKSHFQASKIVDKEI
jgi:hypothetical protein